MAAPSLPPPPEYSWNAIAIGWSVFEWMVGAAWVAGGAVAWFVYRLVLKVAVLDHELRESKKHTDELHAENVKRGDRLAQELGEWRATLQADMRDLGARIDRVYDKLSSPRSR